MIKKPSRRDWHFLIKVEKEMAKLEEVTDQELRQLHEGLLEKGGKKEMALALAAEVAARKLGQRPYPVQLLSAHLLGKSVISQMNTGEGKTLTAALALYLQLLEGKRVALLTSNLYLAERDAAFLEPFFHFFGYDIGLPASIKSQDSRARLAKQEAYKKKLIYSTHAGLAFDYLMDQLASQDQQQVLSKIDYLLLDEADSVLLDAAQMPLIISGAPKLQSNLYQQFSLLASILEKGRDYDLDNKKEQVWLLAPGRTRVEAYLQASSIYQKDQDHLLAHLYLALKAKEFFKKDQDYLLQNGKLILLDRLTARKMDMTRLEGGQHQALEAKEALALSPESKALASISYQDFFALFDQVAGMTGTAVDAASELWSSYGLDVYQIPPQKPLIREDLADRIFLDKASKYQAALRQIQIWHQAGNPVLVIFPQAKELEEFSRLVLAERLPHQSLMARQEKREAAIIADAGKRGQITLATAMAGRGTDIRLEAGLEQVGGLKVLAMEHQDEKRMDQQIRGRAGRQGDPGQSVFYVSLEDRLIQKYNSNQGAVRKWQQQGEFPEKAVARLVKHCQDLASSRAEERRSQTQEFTWILKDLRQSVYEERQRLLTHQGDWQDQLDHLIHSFVEDTLLVEEFRQEGSLYRFLLDHIDYQAKSQDCRLDDWSQESLSHFLDEKIRASLARQEKKLQYPQILAQFYSLAILKALDQAWIDQVDYLEQMSRSYHPYGQAMQDPYLDFAKKSLASFQNMKKAFRKTAIRNLLLSFVSINQEGEVVLHFP